MAKDKESQQFNLIIASPDELMYEDIVVKVEVPSASQQLAILPDHTPLYAQLTKGTILISPKSGSEQTINIEGGIIRVRSNNVSIITGFDTKTPTTTEAL